jgi:hypothetical protein
MRLFNPVTASSSCSKAELLAGLKAYASAENVRFPHLEKLTRAHLIMLSDEVGILLPLEDRADIIKILKGGGVDFEQTEDTYLLVRKAVNAAIGRYGIADLDSLGKNLKRSRLSGFA